MRVALVHDYIKEYGGAESVLEALSDIYIDAPIFTSVYRPQFLGPHRSRLEKKWSKRVHQSFAGHIPFIHKLLSPLRFVSPLLFKSFNFSDYDLIITSATGAFFPNSINKKNAQLVCYCHTPPRYLYGLATARSLDNWYYRLLNIPLQLTLHFYRLFDYSFAQNVDQFIANSSTTSQRIQKYYRRNSIVINPPVDVPLKPSFKANRSNFYLTGGRLTLAKRYDIAIQACNRLGVNLKVFGRGFAGYSDQLHKIAGPTIEFLGEVTQDQKNQLLSQAKGFIFCSDNEDFGIVSVEAQSYGCPVIGYASGGIIETVINGKTGVLFDELSAGSCTEAINKFEKQNIKSSDCFYHSQKFSYQHFVDSIKQIATRK